MSVRQRFQHPLEQGTITGVCHATQWMVLGTELGILSLWDLRFGLLLKSWRAGGGVTALQLHPTKGKGRWVMVSVERGTAVAPLVEVYDIESSKLVEVFEVRVDRPSKAPYTPPRALSVGSTSATAAGTAAATAATATSVIPGRSALIAELAKAQTRVPEYDDSRPAVLAMSVGQRLASMPIPDEGSILDVRSPGPPAPGYLLTAGQDRVVRYFDLARPGEGMVICGSPKQRDVVFKSANVPLAADAGSSGSGSGNGNGGGSVLLNYTVPRSGTVDKRMSGAGAGAGAGASGSGSASAEGSADGQVRERERMESVRETLGGRAPLRPHFDAVCALGTVETGVSSCVISGDRGGVVKVWRVEGGGRG